MDSETFVKSLAQRHTVNRCWSLVLNSGLIPELVGLIDLQLGQRQTKSYTSEGHKDTPVACCSLGLGCPHRAPSLRRHLFFVHLSYPFFCFIFVRGTYLTSRLNLLFVYYRSLY